MSIQLFHDASEANAEPPIGRIEFSVPDDARSDTLIQNIVEGSVPPSGHPVVGEIPKELRDVWRGNAVTVAAALHSVLLQFTRQAPEGISDEFYISLDLSQPLEIRLKASRTGYIPPEGGIVLKGGERALVPLSVSIHKHQRMIVGVSRFTSERPRTLLLCPREYSTADEENSGDKDKDGPKDRVLVDSGYRITGASGEVDGTVKGSVWSSTGNAEATGGILTSIHIPRSLEFYDRSWSRTAAIALMYKAKSVGNSDTNPVVVPSSATGSGIGIYSNLSLENSAGYKRSIKKYSALTYKSVTFPPIPPLVLASGGDQGKGTCYLISVEEWGEEQFSKEARETSTLR